jgi:hypothetical protein
MSASASLHELLSKSFDVDCDKDPFAFTSSASDAVGTFRAFDVADDEVEAFVWLPALPPILGLREPLAFAVADRDDDVDDVGEGGTLFRGTAFTLTPAGILLLPTVSGVDDDDDDDDDDDVDLPPPEPELPPALGADGGFPPLKLPGTLMFFGVPELLFGVGGFDDAALDVPLPLPPSFMVS